MPRYGIKINRFDGGLNTQVSPLTGNLNESPDLLNVEFDNLGAVGTRLGYTQYGTISTGPVNLLINYRSDTDNQLVAVCDGSLYQKDGTNTFVVATEGQDIMATQTRVVGHNYQNYLFMANGVEAYKYDGVTATRWGVSAPSNTIYAETNGSVVSNFTYVSSSYKFVAVDALGNESYPSSAYTSTYFVWPFVTLPLTLQLGPFPASHGVAEIDVYRYRHGDPGDYQLLTAMAADATSFDDYFEDLSTTIAVDAPTTPPPLSVFIPHIGYLFGASETSNPTRLYYSGINAPTKWDVEDFIRVGDGDGYPIRALAVMGSNLIICKDDGAGEGSIWLLYTPDADPNNWQLSRFNTSYGSVAPKAAARFSQFIMVLNKNGFYNLAETGVGDTQSESLSYNIEPTVLEFANEFLKDAVAVTFKNKTYVAVPGTSGSRINDTVYLYDYIRGRDEVSKYSGAWSKFDVSLCDMAIFNGILYGGTYDGKIMQLNNGHTDNSAAISSYYQTMAIYGVDEHRENDKVWRKCRITVDTPGNWDMTVSYSQDFYNDSGDSTRLNLNPGGAAWGDSSESYWGITSWGRDFVRKTYTINLDTLVSKSIMFKFSSDSTNYWKVYDMQLEYNLRGVR